MYVLDFLRTRRVGFETFFHRPASSATRLAGCLHVPGRSVAKLVLVKAGEEFVLAVLPATSRVDLDRLGDALRIAKGFGPPGDARRGAADLRELRARGHPGLRQALRIEDGR